MKKKGFTLIEMIIVIVIIGILAAAILPKILGAKDRANDVKRIADLRNVATALEMYYQDNGEYPGGCDDFSRTLKKNQPLKGYIKEIPSDPVRNNKIGAHVEGEYVYCALRKYGIEKNAYMLEGKTSTLKSTNFFDSLRPPGPSSAPTWSWEGLQNGLEKCNGKIKKGSPENKEKCITNQERFRYLLLSP